MVTPRLCEWNPAANRGRFAHEDACSKPATVSVGTTLSNNYHLCPDCAALPRFRRFKKRVLKQERR